MKNLGVEITNHHYQQFVEGRSTVSLSGRYLVEGEMPRQRPIFSPPGR